MTPPDLVVGRWGARFLGRSFPCATGRGGIRARKREGDGATPRGIHRLIGLLYRPDRIARGAIVQAGAPGWALPIGPRDLWSDDPADDAYNLMVRAPHAHGHERLRRADPRYDLVLLTDYNWPVARAGAGSAIFVHIWESPRHPTSGCVAFRRDHLLWIARRIRLGSRLIVHG